MDGFKSTIGIYGFIELKLQKFLNTPIWSGIIRSGRGYVYWPRPSLVLCSRRVKEAIYITKSHYGSWHNFSPTQHQQVRPASSSVARDHWGIFELIIKESGDEGSDGKRRKSEATFPSLSFSFPFPSLLAPYARSQHPSLALLAWLACSRVPQSPLSLWKACGGGSRLGNVSFRDWSIDPGVPAVSGCSPE